MQASLEVPTATSYREVPANAYGLKAEQILFADDRELRGFVSVKRMSAYRDQEFKVSHQQSKHFKQRLKKRGHKGAEYWAEFHKSGKGTRADEYQQYVIPTTVIELKGKDAI